MSIRQTTPEQTTAMVTNKNELASIRTTRKLIHVARRHFSLYGYANTSLEAIVEEMNMTRGAIYHHYKNKKALFIAVLHQVQAEVGEHVEREAMTSADTWEQLILGCVGFVEAATLDTNRRILLIDAPTVIEWDEWRRIDNENSVALLEEQLLTIKAGGGLVSIDVRLLSHMISGALNDLSLYLAETKLLDRDSIYHSIAHLVKGFRNNVKEI